jgi:Tol biopolymer transport system component
VPARYGSYEVRLLDLLPDPMLVLWLKADNGGIDLLYPLPLGPDPSFNHPWQGQIQERLYTVLAFTKAYRPIALAEFAPIDLKDTDSGPDMTASPAAVAAAFPPTTFESKVIVLGPATDLADALDTLHYATFVSSDGCRIAWVGAEGGQFHLFVDGIPGPGFDEVSHPFFSPDGQHVAYEGQPQNLIHQSQEIVDDKPGPLFYDVGETGFNPANEQLYYVAENASRENQLVMGGNPGPEYDEIGWLEFSPDGQHLAYAASIQVSKEGEKYRAEDHFVLDGTSSPAFGSVTSIIFSPDSKHWAYVARNGKQSQVIADGTPGPLFDDIEDYDDQHIRYSPDSKHLYYIAEIGNRPQLIEDGVPSAASMPVFSPDGQHIVFYTGIEGKAYVVLDGKATPLPDGVRLGSPLGSAPFTFSPDSNRVAYLASKNQKSWLVVDGVSGPEFDGVSYDYTLSHGKDPLFKFSPDSKHTAMLGQTGDKWQVVLDGKPGVAFLANLHDLTFSPDSNRVAYVAEFGQEPKGGESKLYHQNNWQIVLDNTPGPKFDEISSPLIFSPDSKHLAFAALKKDQWSVYVDGTAGPAFAAIAAGPVLLKDGRLEYLAIQKDGATDKLMRVDVPDFGTAKP